MTKLKAPAGALTKAQKSVFRQLCQALNAMPVEAVDAWQVVIAAKLLTTALQLEKAIEVEGVVTPDKAHGGDLRKNPLLSPYRQFLKDAETSLAALGLNPAARARLRLDFDREKASFEELLKDVKWL